MELKHSQRCRLGQREQFYSYLYGIETEKSYNSNYLPDGFTRTFMELKLIKNIKLLNRLKFYSYLYGIETCKKAPKGIPGTEFYSYLYGIETTYIQSCGIWGFRFTRTFMELKRSSLRLFNISSCVLLVPLWNWNGITSLQKVGNRSFTRTFMELKRRTSSSSKDLTNVLLVPLWNWNS